ncbi:hypothetical protein PspLS_04655 [Pyricularia sp. CBS 133598]|nr:hypothetical protein PspLS_04655 [Pyricularia sp. CBS 133598]
MATNDETPKRELTPAAATSTAPAATRSTSPRAGTPPASSLPQKRVLMEDDHAPAVRSPLNPDARSAPARAQSQARDEQQPSGVAAREKRTKKESLKKRESKGVVGGAGGSATAESSRATPDPRQKDQSPVDPNKAAPARYPQLLPAMRSSDFEAPRAPTFTSHHEVTGPDGETIEFGETTEQSVNRKGYVYNYCIADPAFPSMVYYRHTDQLPYTAHLSIEDAAQQMYFDRSAMHVTGELGFRMARANVGVREGRWYWECKVTRGVINPERSKQKSAENDAEGEANEAKSHGHVRMGWARREASRDAPVGLDAYSYAIRDVGGQKVHMSRPKDFFPPGEDVREGDVIGLEICLPSEQLHRKVVQGHYNPAVDLLDEETPDLHTAAEASNIVRERVVIRGKTNLFSEVFDYHPIKELEDLMNPSPMAAAGAGHGHLSERPNPNHRVPCLRTLPKSYIKIYKNGVLMGTPFEDLLSFLPPASTPNAKLQDGAKEGFDDGTVGYYPAVSVFRGGAAEVNFGPDFWYPPPGYGAAIAAPATNGDVEMTDAGATAVVNTNTEPSAPQTAKPMFERYNEQIAEDIVYDIIDEVHFWVQDGRKADGNMDGLDAERMQED